MITVTGLPFNKLLNLQSADFAATLPPERPRVNQKYNVDSIPN